MNRKECKRISHLMISAIIISILFAFPTIAFADVTSVALASNTTFNAGGGAQVIDSSLTLNGTGNLAGATVNIDSNFNGSADSLSYGTVPSGLTAVYNSSTGVLTISGTADISAYQDFLRTVKFNTSSTSGTRSIFLSVSTTSSKAVYNSPTKHYYEFVSTAASTTSWATAKAAAEARSYNGMPGYLATITSSQENAFILSKCQGAGWIGASDTASEGTWKWVTGPEAGNVCTYTNWASGEPNNGGGGGYTENYLHIVGPDGLWSYAAGQWNDFEGIAASQIKGYVVEYGNQTIGDSSVTTSSFSASTTLTISAKSKPTVTTGSVSNNMDGADATLAGNVTSDGNDTITERGICYGTSANPDINGSKVTSAGTTGTFTATVNGLAQGITYHYRAYAQNNAGVSYGSDSTFTTPAKPVVSTSAVSTITATGATLNGNVSSDGGLAVSERGFYYSTETNPGVGGTKVIVAGTTGIFSDTLTLNTGTTYYYIAYATNALGTTDGSEQSFVTALANPFITLTPDTTSITVSWPAVDNATSYEVYCDGSETPINVTETSYTDSLLNQKTSHSYKVVAINAVSKSANDVEKTCSTIEQTYTVTGTVTDTDGNPITGATVTLTPDAGTPNPATTGNDGKYTINAIPEGSYTITVALPNGGGSFTKSITIPDSGGSNTFNIQQPTEKTYSVSGTVKDHLGNTASGAAVKLMKGDIQIGTSGVTADSNGEFTISDVPNGTYNLVVTKDEITVTIIIEVSNVNNTLTSAITLPSGKTSSIVEVIGSGTPKIVVGNLDGQFLTSAAANDKGVTSDDKDVVTNGGSVEIKLTAEKKDDTATNAGNISATATSDGKTVGFYIDLSVLKTVTPSGGSISTTTLVELSDLVDILIPLDETLQGKSNYVVYRYHDGEVNAITTKENDGEKIALVDEGATIKLTAKKFSIYAIAYNTSSSSTSGSSSHKSSTSTSSTITAEQSKGGNVSLNTDKKTATIMPDDGYVIADVLVDGKSIGAVGTYTAADNSTHTITAVFIKETALPYYLKNDQKVYIGFSAIAENFYKYIAPDGVSVKFKENPKNFTDNTIAWAKPSVDFVTEHEIFLGTQEDQFGPNESMTRAMFVTVIGRIYERSYGSVSGTSSLSDVNDNQYYAKYIAWANENDIIKGVGENLFAPNTEVTREQMAVIMLNFATFLKKADIADSALEYSDSASISTWATDGAKYCQKTKVITGREGGSFVPQGSATRAEVAAVIERFIKTILK